ncbi:MAG: acetylxylan esterase [Kofleriaceae bacterium]
MSDRCLLALALLVAACGGDSQVLPDAQPDAPTVRPLTLADVIAPVTPDELALVDSEWAATDITAHEVVVEASGSLMLGTVPVAFRVLSHTVAGQRHYGAVLVPAGLVGPAPVLVYTHGGFTGEGGFPHFAVEDLQFRIPGQPLRDKLVYVVPAYRGERIRIADVTYTSEGTALIGTTDLVDTAALLSAVVATTPQADATRVGVFGESRGGLVALGVGARDDRIKLVVDAFGPTDFRLSLRGVDPATFAGSVAAAVADPTNPVHLLTRSLMPLDQITANADGSLAITAAGYTEMRRRMAATSAVAAPLALPPTQVHHGDADTTSSVEDSRALRDAMAAAGRPSPSAEFTYFEYAGGMHSLDSLPGVTDRIADAITLHLGP